MLLNAFVTGVATAAFSMSLPLIRSMSLRKEASSEVFEQASLSFYKKSMSLLTEHGELPAEVVRTLCAAGEVLTSYRRIKAMAKRMAKATDRTMPPDERARWEEALASMTPAQRQLFDDAMASCLEAIVFSSVRHQGKILETVFSAARERPHSKFSTTEAKLGILAVSHSVTCPAAA